ncbi:MAG: L-threonylcarbamoyladenylate synthase [Patescibacteria group bacterium]
MKTIKVDLKGDFSEAIREAVAVLKLGGTIIYPTDTLYALGANALELGPVERVFKIKDRAREKPLPLAVRNVQWAKELSFIYKKEEKILNSVWPGAVTVVLPKRNIVSSIVTAGQPSVALRVPNYPFVDRLLGHFGYPLTATSANISGEEASRKISEVIDLFKENYYKPDLVIDAGDLPESEPSTILDLTTDRPKILRVGPVKPETLRKLLEV